MLCFSDIYIQGNSFRLLTRPQIEKQNQSKAQTANSTSRMILQEHSISLDILGQIWPTASLL